LDQRALGQNVICVKWGDKFSSDHVNRLYRMVRKNTSLPFTFYCMTEDPAGIDTNINIVPLNLELELHSWWWKICLFKHNLVPGKVNVYFDLDVVIQNNIDHFFDVGNKIKIIDTSFTDGDKLINFDNGSINYYNSSILAWKNNTTGSIFSDFFVNSSLYKRVYVGLDRFLFNEISNQRFEPWGEDDYYFRTKQGQNLKPNDKVPHPQGSIASYFYPEKKVCVFNQAHEPKFYKGYEDYFL
jgi:hypothetical protein